MEYDRMREVILAAGDGGTWEFDGLTWFNTRRGAFSQAELACEETGLVMMASAAGTHEWGASGWTLVNATPRTGFRLDYDSLRMVTTTMGPLHYVGDAWAGTSNGFADDMAFHEGIGTAVSLTYYYQNNPGVENDFFSRTLEWDGANTFQVDSPNVPARSGAAHVYNPLLDAVLIFGGMYLNAASNPLLNDTWYYTGSGWALLSALGPPPARSEARLVWDEARQQVVMFSGGADIWALRVTSTWPDENCVNGVDDDGDGDVDCADDDCEHHGCASGAGRCKNGTCVEMAGGCANQVDDDGDGLVDCAESECDREVCLVSGGGVTRCGAGICDSCGNGYLETVNHEECDDGNGATGDGCRPNCTLECGSGTGAKVGFVNAAAGSCILGFQVWRTWTDAQNQCVALGGRLISITSATENTLANSACSRVGGQCHIGLTDEGHEGTWTWVGGEALSYTNWYTGEPNGLAVENCARLYTPYAGTWQDIACTTAQYYLCEVPLGDEICGNGVDDDADGDVDCEDVDCEGLPCGDNRACDAGLCVP